MHAAAAGRDTDENIDAGADRHAKPVECRVSQAQRADEDRLRPAAYARCDLVAPAQPAHCIAVGTAASLAGAMLSPHDTHVP